MWGGGVREHWSRAKGRIGPHQGASLVPCPGITLGSRICPFPRPHGFLGKERVLTCPHPLPSPGMEQLEGCHTGCVLRRRDPGLDGSREKALPLISWPQLGLGQEGLEKWAWLGRLGRRELEAGARPAPLPGSLGPISSGCFQAGPARGRGREQGACFQAKVQGSLFLIPRPLAQGSH